MIEQHHYNTYSSSKYSNERRTLYLALNRQGQSRKVMLHANQPLGRLSSYTRVITRIVSSDRAEELHPVRHHGHFCASTNTERTAFVPLSSATPPTNIARCRKRKRRKKKKRKCLDGEERELCVRRQTVLVRKPLVRLNSTRIKCEPERSDECQRVEVTEKKQRHKASNKIGDNKQTLVGAKKRRRLPKGHLRKKKPRVLTTTELPVTGETLSDEDYAVDSTTAWEWEYTTATYDDTSTPRLDWLSYHPSPLFISTIYCILKIVNNCLHNWIYLAINITTGLCHFLSHLLIQTCLTYVVGGKFKQSDHPSTLLCQLRLPAHLHFHTPSYFSFTYLLNPAVRNGAEKLWYTWRCLSLSCNPTVP